MYATLILSAALSGSLFADEPKEPAAGWNGVFPDVPVYQRTFQTPVVAKGEKPVVYSQEVRYEWTGNDLRIATATLARDPAFKTKYAAGALKKDGAEEVEVGKRKGWLLPSKKDGDFEVQTLIVPLAEDKAFVLKGRGSLRDDRLTAWAAGFDLDKVEKALDKPPQIDK